MFLQSLRRHKAMMKVFTLLVMMGSISYCNHEMATNESSTMDADAPSCSETVQTTITGTTTSRSGEALV